jgi:hypothetical protein
MGCGQVPAAGFCCFGVGVGADAAVAAATDENGKVSPMLTAMVIARKKTSFESGMVNLV